MVKRLPFTRAKTREEMRKIQKALAITKSVFKDMESPFGKTEKKVAKEIRKIIKSMGGGFSFKPIVASGRNTCFVHHKPDKRIVRKGKPLMLDIGARFRGYCSDITRMYIPKEDKKIRVLYRSVSGIQKKLIKELRPGIDFREINELYKKLMERKGYKLKHSIGHGLGLRIHERVGRLETGMVITIEPGVYIKGFGGCRVEDMVLITRDGFSVLSKSIPEELTW